MSKINQVRTSKAIKFFEGVYAKNYGLSRYHSDSEPVIFHGCYSMDDLASIRLHCGIVVLVWSGSDVLRMIMDGGPRNPNWSVVKRENVYHIAVSNFIESSLLQCGIKSIKLPVHVADIEAFTPQPRGDKIYSYMPSYDRRKYGSYILDMIIGVLGRDKFIIADSTIPKEKMPDIYRQCAIGLRLTKHDAFSATVSEMGLMGRRVVWNGDSPNALGYQTPGDVLTHIETELSRKDDYGHVAAQMRNYIDIGDDWLHTEFYINGQSRTQNSCGNGATGSDRGVRAHDTQPVEGDASSCCLTEAACGCGELDAISGT